MCSYVRFEYLSVLNEFKLNECVCAEEFITSQVRVGNEEAESTKTHKQINFH